MKAANNYPLLGVFAAATMLVAGCGGSDKPGMAPAPTGNTMPVISGITDKISDQDMTLGPIEFGIADAESDVSTLKVAAAADGSALFPADGVVVSGSGATRSLTLTPFEATTGTATIAVLVSDPDGASTTRTFNVTVRARSASMRDVALDTFAKAEADPQTAVNGLTFDQDADDPALFAPLLPEGEE
jgi:hypothetical protein